MSARRRLILVFLAVVTVLCVAPPDRADAASRARCVQYHELFRAYGLPVSTFSAIAWRESSCNHRSFVIDHDDAGGGLLGINLKGRLARVWFNWCGATLGNIRNAEVNVRCAAEAYERLGLRPWR
jgi:hypothetical protein